MPQRITKRNQETGEVFSFDWAGSKAPTDDDIDRAYKQRNEAKIAALDKMEATKAPWYDRALASDTGQVTLGVLERLGLPREYHPVDSAKEMISGLGQAANYWHPDAARPGMAPNQQGPPEHFEHPRLAGAVKATRGAMGLVAPFATAAGYITNPVATGAAFLSGGLAGDAVRENAPEDWAPETKEAAETAANLIVGGGVGYLGHMPAAGPRPRRSAAMAGTRPELPPPGIDIRGGGAGPNYGTPGPAQYPPRSLPPAPPRRLTGPQNRGLPEPLPVTPQEASFNWQEPPAPPTDSAVPTPTPPTPRMNRAQRRASAMPPGEALEVDRGAGIREDIAQREFGTSFANLDNTARLLVDDLIAQGHVGVTPPQQLPPAGTYQEPISYNVSPIKPNWGAPKPEHWAVPQDLVSAAPEPLSPSEVSSVSPAEARPPSVESGEAPVVEPPPTPQGLTPEVLPAVQSPAPPVAQAPVTIEAAAPKPAPIKPPLAPPLRPPVQQPVPQAPVPQAPPPAPVPPQAPQQAQGEITGPPQAPPASDVAAAAMRQALQLKPVAPPEGIIPEVLPPVEQPKAPLIPEGEKTPVNAAPPPGNRWNGDKGAIPGEPLYFMGEDMDSSPVAIVEVEDPTRGISTYELMTSDGDSLGVFNSPKDAAAAGEYFVDNPDKVTGVVKPKEPVTIDVKAQPSGQIEAPAPTAPPEKSLAQKAMELSKKGRVVPPGFPEPKAVEPPPPPKELPKVEPPKPIEAKPREDVKIEEKEEPIAPTPQEESDLSPSQKKVVDASNKVLEFLKLRRDVGIPDLQTKFGLTIDQSLDALRALEKRGLISSKKGKWNYNRMPGEKAPTEPGPVAPPAEMKGKEPGPVAPPSEVEAPKTVEAEVKELDQISTGSRDIKLIRAIENARKKFPNGSAEQIGELVYYQRLNSKGKSTYSKEAYAELVRSHLGLERSGEGASTALPDKVLERLKSDSEEAEGRKASTQEKAPKVESSAAAEPPPKVTEPKAEKTGKQVEGARGKRIAEIEKQVADAIAEGDDPSVYHRNLESEKRSAEVERTGNKKARAIVQEMDQTFKRIEELETKQDKLALNNDEQAEYDSLTSRYNKLEQQRDFEMKPEKEKYGDYGGGLKDLHGEAAAMGYKSREQHKFLTERAKEGGYIKESLKEFENDLEGMRKFEEEIRTERLEKEQEIGDLMDEEMDGTLKPKGKSRLKELLTDETGTANFSEGWKNLVDLLSPAIKGWLQSGETALGKEGASKLESRVRHARTMGEMSAGELTADYKDNIRNLTRAEAENLLSVLRGDERAVNAKVAQAARKENVRFKKIMDAMEDNNLQVNIDPLDSSRTDRAVLSDFYTAAGKKLAEFEQLGPRTKPPAHMREGAGMVGGIPEDVHKYIEQVKKKGGDWRTAYDIMDAYFNPNKMSAKGQKLWDAFAGFQVATKLGLSVISNLTQSGNTALVAGNLTTAKAFAKMMRDRPAARDFALRSGSTLSSVTHETAMNAGAMPRGFAGRMMESTGFAPVEVFNRTLATMTGAEHAVKMFNKLKAKPSDIYARRHLTKWLGLDPEVLLKQNKLTPEQVKVAAHTLADRTQFRTTPLEIPHEWGSTGLTKTLTLFKNFGFNHAKFMLKDILMKEVGKGNFRPFIPLFTLVPALGYLAHNMKNFAVGKQQSEKFWKWIVDIYAAGGGAGLLQDMATSAAVGNVAGFLGGTAAGDLASFAESIFKSGQQGSPKPLAKEVVKRIPVGRPIVGHTDYFQPKKAHARPWGTLP